jgi:hypothetical protein
MSHNTIKAIDLFCRVAHWNSSLKNAHNDEVKDWTGKRDRELMKFRKAMAKITLQEFLAGRWGNTSMEKRMEQWEEMGRARASESICRA